MPDLFARLLEGLSARYRLEQELGRGGMAVVYLADDLKHHRKVAVKVLLPELAQSIGTERFLKEIAIAAQLAHPHILPVHDSGEADGLLYYVMPYVEGESLRDRLTRERQLPMDDTVRILREVASALHYAHARGIVHRDIKPENILLLDGQAVVADFGIARALDAAGTEPLTRTGLALGTPSYMSPEQAAGDRGLDGRSDVYSLGCMAYEMLCGAPPFTGPNPQALIARHTLDPVPPLKTLRPTVPDGVERAIQRALAKVPADRFATAGQFADALQGAGAVEAPRAPRVESRRVLGIALAVAGVLLAGGWALVKAASDRAASRIQSLAVLPFEAPPGGPDQEYLVAGMHEALIDELAQLGELRVISQRTMLQYAGSSKSVPQIAQELDVAGVVEGSVERDRDSVRLRVRLIRAQPREENLWAQTYARGTEDLSVIQAEVAREVARRAGVRLADRQEAGRDRRVAPEVYEAYLRGMHFLGKRTPEDRRRGIEYLQAAIDRDPGNALAYAGLARGYASLGHDDAMIPDALPRARAAAVRAVGLDSGLAEGHAAVGLIKSYYERDWEGAERAFRRAIQLNPSDAMSHYHYSWYLLLFDRVDEAIREHKLAQELDPLTLQHTADLSLLYSWIGRAEDASREAERGRAIDSADARVLLALGVAYAEKGMPQEAVAAHERLAAVFPPWSWALGGTLARFGRRDDALRVARELEGRPPTSWRAFGLAYVYAALGDRDAAFRWLGYESPHAWVPWVRNWPQFAPIRDDPRFAEFLRSYRLPPFPREDVGPRS
ncbi:MAG: protein kinase domain-containing protein [Gemmatimonadales bacterium]